jgi:hypothetical protein
VGLQLQLLRSPQIAKSVCHRRKVLFSASGFTASYAPIREPDIVQQHGEYSVHAAWKLSDAEDVFVGFAVHFSSEANLPTIGLPMPTHQTELHERDFRTESGLGGSAVYFAVTSPFGPKYFTSAIIRLAPAQYAQIRDTSDSPAGWSRAAKVLTTFRFDRDAVISSPANSHELEAAHAFDHHLAT